MNGHNLTILLLILIITIVIIIIIIIVLLPPTPLLQQLLLPILPLQQLPLLLLLILQSTAASHHKTNKPNSLLTPKQRFRSYLIILNPIQNHLGLLTDPKQTLGLNRNHQTSDSKRASRLALCVIWE